MGWLVYVAWFFGGIFFANAIPHYVSGVMGRPFQSPFATPSGAGLSSSTLNVAWGCINLLAAYVLLGHVGNFALRSFPDAAAVGLGGLLLSLFNARYFGRFHGGNDSERA